MVALSRDMLSRIRVNRSWASGYPELMGDRTSSQPFLDAGELSLVHFKWSLRAFVWSPEQNSPCPP